jgi:Ca2+-binding EF-hand superfamily protein
LEGWINEIDSDGDANIDFHEFLKFNAMSIKKKKDKETNFDNEM